MIERETKKEGRLNINIKSNRNRRKIAEKDRDEKTEVRMPRSECPGQETEGRKERSESRGRKTEVRNQRSENRGHKSKDKYSQFEWILQ